MQPHHPQPSSELQQTLGMFRRELLLVGLFSLIANVLMLTPTVYMLQVYDRVMVSGSELTLLAVSIITLFLFGVMAFSEWIRSRLLVRTSVRIDQQLSPRIFEATYAAQLNRPSNENSKAFSDLVNLRQFITGSGVFAFFDAPWVPVYIAVLFFLHPYLGGLSLVFAIIQAALGWLTNRSQKRHADLTQKSQRGAGMFLFSKLQGAEVVESMGMRTHLYKEWEKRQISSLGVHDESAAMKHKHTAINKFVRYSQQSIALGAGALLVIDGQLSPGGMIATNILMSRALAPIEQMVGVWGAFNNVRRAYRRLAQRLANFPSKIRSLSPDAPQGRIDMVDVSAFTPEPDNQRPILQHLNLRFNPGTITAVIGPSGSGKTTFVRTLLGIWPQWTGKVLLDGVPVESLDRDRNGHMIGYLPQDIELFEGTIAENIARFNELDTDPIIAAARCAGLHEMILQFPKGYDTPIGDGGSMLSGGQRQRIALARAVYGEPRLLVLDEPNANLDDAGEQALAQAMEQLKAKGCTILLITHRPAGLTIADQVLVLNAGQVQAFGPKAAVIQSLRQTSTGRPAPEAQPTSQVAGGSTTESATH